jgi:predicted nucleotide-binding protein
LDNLKKLRAKTDLLKSTISEKIEVAEKSNSLDTTQVFIVHGHDEEAKAKTARFIEILGLKPIILHEQASGSKTIMEKIEAYSNVGFGIVLYTPCDIGAKNDEKTNFKNRARQNVVFEHGFLIGKIGRENVCALVKGEIETPNDISGVVYIKMDDDEAWHLKIVRELKNSGYEIDMNKII